MKIDKYTPATLPTRDEALRMAFERKAWAKTARDQDMSGSAYEFELTALLLRFYAEHTDEP